MRRGDGSARHRLRAARGLGLLWLLVCGLAGCSSYVSTSQQLRPLVRDGRYDVALEKIAPLNSETSRLLYLYERGLLLHQQDHFEESNAALEQAEELRDDLYTRSLSREAGALLVSEGVRQYRGERFEVALLHSRRKSTTISIATRTRRRW